MRNGLPTACVAITRRNGTRFGGTQVNIRFLSSPGNFRYTTVISKRQGGAVERNRIRRSIRGIMQRKFSQYPQGWYIVYYNDSCSAYNRMSIEKELDNIAALIARNRISADNSRKVNEDPQ